MCSPPSICRIVNHFRSAFRIIHGHAEPAPIGVARFRDESGASAAECKSEILGKFRAGAKPPTLSVMSDILRSPKETALCAFADRAFVNAAATIFGDAGVAGLLTDKAAIELRNRAAHDTVLTRADALQSRAWALEILRLL